MKYLVFRLGGEQYGVRLLKIREVIAPSEITPIPYAPAYFRGIMNLRGRVISVIDLRSKLGIDAAAADPEAAIVIFDLEAGSLGAIVDSVELVSEIEDSDIQPTPELETRARAAFVEGVARRGGRLVLLLDVAKALSLEDLAAVRTIQGERAA